MEWLEWARALAALVFVLALIGGAAVLARRFGMLSGVRAGQQRRLKVVESLMIDARRKILIVRCDEREHLLLIGDGGNRKLESQPAKAISE